MASDRDFADLVRPLREDNRSGASQLARTAADVLRRAAVRVQAGSLDELRWGLGEVCRAVLDAQPSMAPMVTLVRRVLEAVEGAGSLEEGRHAAASAADDFRHGYEERTRAVVRAAADVLPAGGTVATISASGAVRALLESEAGPRGIGVVCFESRPMQEGRALARALAESGVEVTYAVDAAVGALVPDCASVLIGTDAIGDRGAVNKIGSLALARAARAHGVPVYVLADETKLLPRGYPQLVDDDRPPEEVWDAPAGITVWNRYFEIVPMTLVSGVVTEEGLQTPEQVGRLRDTMELPAGLRAWAVGRSRGDDRA